MPPNASAAPAGSELRRALPAYLLAFLIVALDQITKRWAEASFADSDLEVLGRWLQFTFTENPGMAFSLFPNGGQFLGLAAVVAVGVVSAVLARPRPRLERVAFALVLGGAMGNLTDRIFRGPGFLDGPVIDWIATPFIPTFNVADSAVTIAIVLLLLGTLVQGRRSTA